jgi:thiol-disulfide isomerase/thioredoxin
MARREAASSGGRRRLLSPGLRIVSAAAVLFLLLCVPAEAQRATDFTLKDLSGRPWILSECLAHNVVLLDFWATWCGPCQKELPHLQRLQDAYGEKGLQVLTVNIDGPDGTADVSAVVDRYGFRFPVLLDADSRVVSIYNPSLILPHSVLVDRRGVIRHVHQGYSPGDERILEDRIAALLEEPEAKHQSGLSVRVNESSLLRLPKEGTRGSDPESGYTESLNQMDLILSRGGLLAGVRLDANVDLSPASSHFSLAKRFVQYATTTFQGAAGDFYTSLGRGLVFSVTKLFEEEGIDYVVDKTVEGGRASVARGAFSGDVFGGWIERRAEEIVHDKVVGLAAGSTWPGVASIRVHGLRAELQPGAEFRSHHVDTGSLSLELPDVAGAGAVYGEYSLIRRRTYKAEAPVDGHGLYVSSKVHAGRFSLLLELKDYKQLDFEYCHPPLLESEELDLLANQFDVDRTDVSGYAARLDYYDPTSETLLYGKYLRVRDDPDDHPVYGVYDREIGHVFAGIEKRFAGGGYVNGLAGWRRETAAPAYFPTEGDTIHDQINVSWPWRGVWSLEADWKHKIFDGGSYDYSEIRTALSLHRAPRWVLSALYEWTTDPAVLFVSHRRAYPAGQLDVRFARGHSVRVFIGTSKGSVKCAGGVCRPFPAFEGIRVEGFLRF